MRWQIGAPDYQGQSFTREQIEDLIREKKLLSTDLIQREGEAWKAVQDYEEFRDLVEPEPTERRRRPGTRTQALKVSKRPGSTTSRNRAVPPPEPKIATKAGPPQVVIPPPASHSSTGKTTRLTPALKRPPPPPPPPEPEPPPEAPPEPLPEASPEVVAEPAAGDAPTPPAVPAVAPAKSSAIPKRITRAGLKVALPPRVVPKLELAAFSAQDAARSIRHMVHPIQILTALLLCPIGALLSLLAWSGSLRSLNISRGGMIAASVLFFLSYSVVHALVTFGVRCSLEGKGRLALIGDYLRGIVGILPGVAAMILIGGLSSVLTAIVPPNNTGVAVILLLAIWPFFLLLALAYLLTGGYLNAIQACEMGSLGNALARLKGLYQSSFRSMLLHSTGVLVAAFGAFAVGLVPALVALLAAADVGGLFLGFVGGLACALSILVLSWGSLVSYLYITRNPQPVPEPAPAAETAASERAETPPVESVAEAPAEEPIPEAPPLDVPEEPPAEQEAPPEEEPR